MVGKTGILGDGRRARILGILGNGMPAVALYAVGWCDFEAVDWHVLEVNTEMNFSESVRAPDVVKTKGADSQVRRAIAQRLAPCKTKHHYSELAKRCAR